MAVALTTGGGALISFAGLDQGEWYSLAALLAWDWGLDGGGRGRGRDLWLQCEQLQNIS